MPFLSYSLFAAFIVAADQIAKYFTVANIELFEEVPFIPGLLQLTYVQNTGAAFSSFEGQQWLFALIFVFFTGLILFEYFKKPMGFKPFERWCIAAIYGGGLGNMIDRVRMGYVVDMIETTFINFPVFNVADCFITCGCILLMGHLILFNKEFWKDDKKKK
ncbi:MAG: signal peptidase II [Oscillospiraceae bacterium]|nr:signal peptidase II [Oscillospiraceae bacterium]